MTSCQLLCKTCSCLLGSVLDTLLLNTATYVYYMATNPFWECSKAGRNGNTLDGKLGGVKPLCSKGELRKTKFLLEVEDGGCGSEFMRTRSTKCEVTHSLVSSTNIYRALGHLLLESHCAGVRVIAGDKIDIIPRL